jgi:hypothetical protein
MARKFLTPIDLSGLELTNFKIHNLSTDPTPKGKGHAYYNTSDNVLKVYNGSDWETVGGAVAYGPLIAAAGAAGKAGRLFVQTTANDIYFDNGTNWVKVSDVYTDAQAVSAVANALGDSLVLADGAFDVNAGWVKNTVGNALGTSGGLTYDGSYFDIDTSVIATKNYVDQQIGNAGVSAGDGIDVTDGVISAKYDNTTLALDSSNRLTLANASSYVTRDNLGSVSLTRLVTDNIESYTGDPLTVAAYGDLSLTSQNGDVILDADGYIYLRNNATQDNRVATQGWVTQHTQAPLAAGSYIDLSNDTVSVQIDGTYIVDNGSGQLTVDTNTLATHSWVSTTYAAKTYVDTAVSNLVDGAPGLLNTLNELAAAIGDDANFATTLTGLVAAKADAADPTISGSLTLSGSGAFTISSNDDIVLAAGSGKKVYLGNASTGNDIVKSSQLSSYVTSTTLADYVTSSSLTTTLGDYVTYSSLSSTLGSYVTSSSLTTTLSNYATTSSLSAYQADLGIGGFSDGLYTDAGFLKVKTGDGITFDGTNAITLALNTGLAISGGLLGIDTFVVATQSDLTTGLSSKMDQIMFGTGLQYITATTVDINYGNVASKLSGAHDEVYTGLSSNNGVLSLVMPGTSSGLSLDEYGSYQLAWNQVASHLAGDGSIGIVADNGILEVDFSLVATKSDVSGKAGKYHETVYLSSTITTYAVDHGLDNIGVTVQVFYQDAPVETDVLIYNSNQISISIADASWVTDGVDAFRVVVVG